MAINQIGQNVREVWHSVGGADRPPVNHKCQRQLKRRRRFDLAHVHSCPANELACRLIEPGTAVESN